MKSAAKVVRDMLDAVLRGDEASAMSHIHPDIKVIEPDSLVYGGVHNGLSAFHTDVYGVILSKLNIGIGRCEVIGSENKVAVSMDVTFTSRKTGQSLLMPFVELYTVCDEKISDLDVYPQDTKRLAEFWDAN